MGHAVEPLNQLFCEGTLAHGFSVTLLMDFPNSPVTSGPHSFMHH